MSSRQGQTHQGRVPTLDMRSDISHSRGEFAEVRLLHFFLLDERTGVHLLVSKYHAQCQRASSHPSFSFSLSHTAHPFTHARRSLHAIRNYARMLAGGCSCSPFLMRCSSPSCGYSSSRWVIDNVNIVLVCGLLFLLPLSRLCGWPAKQSACDYLIVTWSLQHRLSIGRLPTSSHIHALVSVVLHISVTAWVHHLT